MAELLTSWKVDIIGSRFVGYFLVTVEFFSSTKVGCLGGVDYYLFLFILILPA